MCLGVYGKVVELCGETVKVDFGGVVKEAIPMVDDLSPGDYVIVHAGMVISKLSEEEFLESLRYIREIAEKLVEDGELPPDELQEIDEVVRRWREKEVE